MSAKRFVITVTLGLLGLVVALAWLSAGSPGGAQAAAVRASLAGIPGCPAGLPDCEYDVSQDGMDAGGGGNLTRVTPGYDTDVNNSGGLSQGVFSADWISMTSGTTADLSGVWGSSGEDVFAVGAFGTILHYDGTAWSLMDSGTTEGLYGV